MADTGLLNRAQVARLAEVAADTLPTSGYAQRELNERASSLLALLPSGPPKGETDEEREERITAELDDPRYRYDF